MPVMLGWYEHDRNELRRVPTSDIAPLEPRGGGGVTAKTDATAARRPAGNAGE